MSEDILKLIFPRVVDILIVFSYVISVISVILTLKILWDAMNDK